MTSDPSDSVKSVPDQTSSQSRWRIVGFLLGVILLAGAVFMVWHQRHAVTTALEAIRHPSPWLVMLLLASVAGNVIFTGLLFRVLLSRYGTVGWGEMQAVIASATLINYLPARPGLFSRIAYHRAVNRIRVIDSTKTVIQSALLSLFTAIYLIGAALFGGNHLVTIWVIVTSPVPLLIIGSFRTGWRIWCLAALIRYVEFFIWAVRYYAAFALIGFPLSPSSSLIFASVSILASLIPLVSNGLGIREWVVGLLAPVLTTLELSWGVTAELVNRAAELIVIMILGLLGMAWLVRHRRAIDPAQSPDQSP